MMNGILSKPPLMNQLANPFGSATVQFVIEGLTEDVSLEEVSIKGEQVVLSFELMSWQTGMTPKLATGSNVQFPEGQI
jgi:hypothetical protein